MNKKNIQPVGKVYYWKREDGAYAVQVVHTINYSEMDCAETLDQVKKIAERYGYYLERDRG